MPDIRQSTLVYDYFNRAPETPIASPWVRADSIWSNVNLAAGGLASGPLPYGLLKGTGNPPIGSAAAWTTESWDGDDAEIWAAAMGEPPLTEGWRIGLMRQVGGSNAIDGYMCLPHNFVGSNSWSLRRYTNGGFVGIGSALAVLPVGGEMVLMRRNGNAVEVWRDSSTAGATWTLVVSANDTIYTTGLHAVLGTTGKNTGWDNFGGGPEVPRFWVGMNWRYAERHVSATRALINPSDV